MRIEKSWVAAFATMCLLGTESVSASIEVLEKTGSAFSQIANDALPAVVFINVETTIEVPQRQNRYHSFEEFFGEGQQGRSRGGEPRKYSQEGQGSGFIISKNGYILTNNHVVNEADRITVTLGDGREFEAALIGADPKSEVALIKIEGGDDLPFLELGNSDTLKVGEWVLAAGNPFGLSQTVTAGIVSAKGRDSTGIAEYGNFIQTDAAINPGNSGGPMLNIHGQVVGINTAIYTRTGGYMGIGFAIPINQAAQIKDQLIEHGKVSRSVLGIIIQEVDEDLATSFGLEESGGILVSQVVEGSAAEEAGIEAGDIIVQMDGLQVNKLGAFRNRVASTPPKSKVDLRVFRNGKYKNIAAITKELGGGTKNPFGEESANYEKIGLTVENIDEEMASRLGIEDAEGIVVTEVEQGGSAWRAGLQPGHIISSVNRAEVDTVSAFKNALSKVDEGGKVLLLVKDGRSSRFLVLTLD
jgi:serine protease Do